MTAYGGDRRKTAVIVDDLQTMRIRLRTCLKRAGFEVVSECADAQSALSAVPLHRPDVVLVDLHLPDIDGIDLTKKLKAACPDLRVLMITGEDSETGLLSSLSAGVDGYCLKNAGNDELAMATAQVATGTEWIDPHLAAVLFRRGGARSGGLLENQFDPRQQSLSQREREVLTLVSQGLSNRSIAQQLIVSSETVKSHLRRIMEKLHVSTRTEAAAKALRKGII
jgi:DNA-binding NarL/FixJ family response regulator